MNRVDLGSISKWLVILVALIVVLFPFYWMVNTSLKPSSEIFSNPPTFFSRNWSLDAYVTMWQARPIWRYFVNSLIVSTGATLLSLLLSSLAAYGFTRTARPSKRASGYASTTSFSARSREILEEVTLRSCRRIVAMVRWLALLSP
jgi:ABC-type glycerol-3-phosphate transport system permease component